MTAAAMVIGTITLLFQGFTQAAVAAEIGKTDSIPTSYTAISVSQSAQNSLPEGYQRADYTVVDNDLAYYRDKKPTDKDIYRDTAAEIGAQSLWEVYQLDLEGKELEMAYDPATEDNRANWFGTWWIDGKGNSTQNYSFYVDAVTGEVNSVLYSRILKETVSVAFDSELARNPKKFEDLARSVAEEYDVVHGAVKSAEYVNQGYGSNDPTIDIRVMGENGEQAQISFSRYDKALLSISYNLWCKETDGTAHS